MKLVTIDSVFNRLTHCKRSAKREIAMMSHFEIANARCSSSRTISRHSSTVFFSKHRVEEEQKKRDNVCIDTLKLIITNLYEVPIKVSLNFHARMLAINKKRLNLNNGVALGAIYTRYAIWQKKHIFWFYI